MQFLNSQSPIILAIDTSLDACSVALMLGTEIIEHYEFAPRQHAKLILPMIDDLLIKSNVTLKELNLLAFGSGPGSFTGMRIAAATAQGLALGANIPILPISTLQAMAQGAFRQFGANNVLVCLDARMQEVYFGTYQLASNKIMQSVIPDNLCPPDKISQIAKQDYFAIGNGWLVYEEILQKKLNMQLQHIESNYNPSAQDIACLAKEFLSQGKIFPAEFALPTYLRDQGIWKKISEQGTG